MVLYSTWSALDDGDELVLLVSASHDYSARAVDTSACVHVRIPQSAHIASCELNIA